MVVACALSLSGCAIDPVQSLGGVPTLDDVPSSDGFVAVTAGLEHTCALKASGAAYCWGSNQYGQLGAAADTSCARVDRAIPCRLRPVAVTGGLLFQKVSAGGKITCGISTTARIYCWGDNLRGGLGDPTLRESGTPVPIASTATFSDVATGAEHACGLRTDGVLLCWGWNDMGQLGNNASGSGAATPVAVSGALRFAAVSAGDRRTCARQSDGATYCWGTMWVNTVGGILEATRPQTTPQRVPATAAPLFTSVSVGSATTCGITPALQAFCWEANPAGGIGDGTAAGSSAPRAVSGSTRYVVISSGGMHTCAVDDAGLAHCWGAGQVGQLGISSVLLASRCVGGIACSTTPLRVSGWRQFAAVTAGQGNHTCGLTIGGNVYCWGEGTLGQLGTGRRVSGDWAPKRVLAPL